MKFGLESEKFLFNVKENWPSKGVFSFLDALSDYDNYHGYDIVKQVTNEFVLNMVEVGTKPSHLPMDVLKDYLLLHLLLQNVAMREDVALVPLASMPFDYQPHMTPKWAYYVQNSILDRKKQASWMMSKTSPLRAAGNCAGVHVHIEVETPPEFLFSNRELQDKFNMGLMMTPLIAFSSSPYFFGQHGATSMRGVRYFNGIYKRLPLNGGLPPVMGSSEEVLRFIQDGILNWTQKGLELGFALEDLNRMTSRKGANWNPVRWNRAWNTVEIRCLDSDRIDLDASKFIWICNAMKRLDIKGEALKCRPLKMVREVDAHMIDDCFQVSGGHVTILPTLAIHDLFNRAIIHGTKEPLVERFLHRLVKFAQKDIEADQQWIFQSLKRVLDSHQTTSERILKNSKRQSRINKNQALDIVNFSIDDQKKVIRSIRKMMPEVFEQLEKTRTKVNF
jgi:hypothetical protein